MTTLTKAAVFSIVLVLNSFQLLAQNVSKFEERAKKHSEFIAEKLDLNDNELEQLKDVNLKFGKEREAIMQKENSKAKREELSALKSRYEKEVQAILEKEDFEKFMAINNRIKENRKTKKGLNKAKRFEKNDIDSRIAEYEKLNLNDKQKEDLKLINQKYRNQFQEIKANKESKENVQLMRQLQKDKNEEVSKILDSKQYAIYLELQEKRATQRRLRNK